VLFARAGRGVAGDVPRGTLVTRAFQAKHADESHRAQLRVEVGRLRTALRTLASVSAVTRGFALVSRRSREIVVSARPVEEEHAAVLAFLADGESGRAPPWRLRWGQPADRAAGTGLACGSRQSTVV